ncbi:MAG: sodium:proton antiporter [Burkholderiales bacterium]
MARFVRLPAALVALAANPALAADGAFHGGALSPLWVVPFAGILLSIAVAPVTAPSFWHHHFGKASAFWALAFLVPFAVHFGVDVAAREVAHTLLTEYLPFIVLLFALFTVSGGIHVRGNLHGSPALNTGLLALGTALASVMGTTGAAMLLIRPLLRANDNRRHKAHVVVFFIFLVANIGGALTPLGDPPLFLGFLKGVDFFWTTKAMLWPTLVASAILLAAFYAIDRWLFSQDDEARPSAYDPTPDSPIRIEGRINFLLLAAILACVLASGLWKPGLTVTVYGTTLELQHVLRDGALLAIAWLSWTLTPAAVRRAHHFSWAPMTEVAKLFAGIFLTIIPAIAMLRAGDEGAFAPVVALVTGADGRPNDTLYFLLTGALSSFLDNAPTYLVFFNLAGGDAALLMSEYATTLAAISAGAVFMGANTYIGNAPNFMVKAIAESRGVRMPSFLAYFGWALLALAPVYALLTFLFFR